MLRRRFDCRSISGMLTTTPQTPIKVENFNNFYTLTLFHQEQFDEIFVTIQH